MAVTPPSSDGSSSWTMPPFQLFQVDNNTWLADPESDDRQSSATIWRLMQIDVAVPLLLYSVMWYTVNVIVDYRCWTRWPESVQRRRLVNVTTSLIHSSLSGLYVSGYFVRNWRWMFFSPMYYYSYAETHLIIFCLGYFLHDLVDILLHDKMSISTAVLLVHHVGAFLVFSIPLASHKFLLFAYWGLLMECSSILLHTRSIIKQSGLAAQQPTLAKVVNTANLAAFVVFRFAVQFFQIGWAWTNRHQLNALYLSAAFGGSALFLLINLSLFSRLLYSDGFIGMVAGVSREQFDALLEDNQYRTDNEDCTATKLPPHHVV